MGAAGAQGAGPGPPVPGAHRPEDGGSEGVELALQRLQHLGRRAEGEHLGDAQLDEAELPGELAEGPPADEGVELQAEEGAQRVGVRRAPAGLVVGQDPAAVRVALDAVDDAPEGGVLGGVGHLDLDVLDRHGARVFQQESVAQHGFRRGEPGGFGVARQVEPGQDLLGPAGVPHLAEEALGRRRGAFLGREPEKLLEDGVDQRAPGPVRVGGLGQPVDGPELVQLRAGLEVRGPGGRQGDRRVLGGGPGAL